MDLPARVEDALEDEEVAASVEIGGEDRLYVTPTRTLIYRGQGFLSDDSVEAYPHDAERVEAEIGRRKATIRLDYGIDGTNEFGVPTDVVDDALHPVLAGVLNASGVTTSGETVLYTHRFSELTLIITSHRVAKHVGAAVWDKEFEAVAYADVTGVSVEEGSVASQLVLETADRTQRVKVPQDQAPVVHRRVVEALCEYHGVEEYAAFERLVAEREDEGPPGEEPDQAAGGGFVDDGLDPIETYGADAADAKPASTQTAGTEDDRSDRGLTGGALEDTGSPDPAQDPESATGERADEFADSPFESAATTHIDEDVERRLAALEEVIDEQTRLLEEQRDRLRELVEALNRDR